MQSKPTHVDIKIHITSYKSHGHKAAIFIFKTPNKHNTYKKHKQNLLSGGDIKK